MAESNLWLIFAFLMCDNHDNMKYRNIFLLTLGLLLSLAVHAQKLTVERMAASSVDLSASQFERKDLAGQVCGLVKVQLAAAGAQFEGNVIGTPEYKTGEYWVFMSPGSYMLNVKHPQFIPLNVNFRDYGIQGVQSKSTYLLTLVMPQTGAPVQTQKLIINYSPANAMVLIDSKLYKGNGRAEAVLPVGSHSYVIAAEGYETAEATVKLTASAPRTVTEHLVATQQTSGQSIAQQTTSPGVQQTEVQTTPATTVTPASLSSASSDSGPSVEAITVNGVSFNIVRVDGGTFTMGATPEQGSKVGSDEKPVHQVTLSTYSIGETEVTQALWQAVMGNNPSKYKGSTNPVDGVSWDDCQSFIQKLNELTGRRFRLPTEAEWEFAARGGNKSRGYMYSGSNNIDDVAWYIDNSSSMKTKAVKSKQSNELGLYDISGNVFEWCQDWYGSYINGAQTNPTGSASGSEHVLRGGAFPVPETFCRLSSRFHNKPTSRSNTMGLRLAL